MGTTTQLLWRSWKWPSSTTGVTGRDAKMHGTVSVGEVVMVHSVHVYIIYSVRILLLIWLSLCSYVCAVLQVYHNSHSLTLSSLYLSPFSLLNEAWGSHSLTQLVYLISTLICGPRSTRPWGNMLSRYPNLELRPQIQKYVWLVTVWVWLSIDPTNCRSIF